LKKLLLAAVTVVALTSVSAAAGRMEQPAGTERVLVGFTRTPGAVERAAVARFGGQVSAISST